MKDKAFVFIQLESESMVQATELMEEAYARLYGINGRLRIKVIPETSLSEEERKFIV